MQFNFKKSCLTLSICCFIPFTLSAQNPQTIDVGILQALNTICPVNEIVPDQLSDSLDQYCFFRSVFLIQPGGPAGATGAALTQNSENYVSRQAVSNRLEGRRKDDALPKFGLFASYDSESFDKDPTAFEPGFDSSRDGFTIGIDYRVTNNTVIGFAAGRQNIDGAFRSSGGNFDTDKDKYLIFFSYQPHEKFYLDTMLGFTDDDYKINRRIVFIDTDSVSMAFTDSFVDARSTGDVLEANINAGLNFNSGSLSYGPRFGLSYTRSKIDAFSETGTTGLELAYNQHSERSLISTLGFQLSYANSTSFGVVLPFMAIDYLHEFQQDQENISAFFSGDLRVNPTPVVFSNDTPDRNYLRINFGVSSVFSNGFSAFVNYRSTVSFEDKDIQSLVFGIRKEF